MELLPDGSLQQVKKKRKLPEKEAADIVRQVAVGLKYMHQEYVIHRDLKPENLFLNEVVILLVRATSKLETLDAQFITTKQVCETPLLDVWSILHQSNFLRKATQIRLTPGAWVS